jgi:hypothetical protein
MRWLVPWVVALLGCAAGNSPTRTVDCDGNNYSPAGADDVIVEVTVERGADGEFADPPLCEWKCKPDHAQGNGQCLHEQAAACIDEAPANATSVHTMVTLTYSDEAGWSTPPVCAWACDAGFQDNDRDETCAPACSAETCGDGGACSDATGATACRYASCFHLGAASRSVANGVHSIDPDGDGPLESREVFCTGGWTYEDVAMGQHDREFTPAYQGQSALRAAELGTAGVRDAFAWAYNRAGGMANLGGWQATTNCCFTAVDVYPQFIKRLDGQLLLPGTVGGVKGCDNNFQYVDPIYRLFSAGVVAPAPLPASYLEGLISANSCAINGNPALYAKRYTGLASCAAIKAAGLSLGDGLYMIDPDGLGAGSPIEVVCDMAAGTPGTTIEAIGFGQHDKPYAGFALMSLADLNKPSVRLAFEWYYSRHGGMLNLDPGYRSSKCCFKTAGDPADLLFGGGEQRVAPAMNGAQACNAKYTLSFMPFFIEGLNDQQPAPIWRTFFDDKPPTLAAQCGAANANPGFFIKRY